MKIHEEKRFYYGFDYIRAFFSIAVVSLHTGLVTTLETTHPSIFYLIRYHYEFMLVPIFFLLSLFLYIPRSLSNSMYFYNRLKLLFSMYVFWRIVEFILTSNGNFKFTSISQIVRIILGEGSPTYFLLDLCLMTICMECFIRLNNRKETFNNTLALLLLIGSTVAMLVGYMGFYYIGFPLGYQNPLNFLPYVFCASIMTSLVKSNKFNIKHLMWMILIFCISSISEFYFKNYTIAIASYIPRPYSSWIYFPYARVALIVQAMLILYLLSFVKTEPPKFIRFLSRISLGIYLIHTIIIHYVTKICNCFEIPLEGPVLFLAVLPISGFLVCLFNGWNARRLLHLNSKKASLVSSVDSYPPINPPSLGRKTHLKLEKM